jgi:hypothetical protein
MIGLAKNVPIGPVAVSVSMATSSSLDAHHRVMAHVERRLGADVLIMSVRHSDVYIYR